MKTIDEKVKFFDEVSATASRLRSTVPGDLLRRVGIAVTPNELSDLSDAAMHLSPPLVQSYFDPFPPEQMLVMDGIPVTTVTPHQGGRKGKKLIKRTVTQYKCKCDGCGELDWRSRLKPIWDAHYGLCNSCGGIMRLVQEDIDD